ncbi:hypothetical protein I3760_16G025100 [Carya illinoinensis]|nr:hypothetical protein I3760_16G025100 [Carya illinoinensis]
MVDNSTTNNNQQLPGQDLLLRGGSQVVHHDERSSELQTGAWRPVLSATAYVILAFGCGWAWRLVLEYSLSH